MDIVKFYNVRMGIKFKNPCDSPMLRKLFQPKAIVRWDIIEKETVVEIIFRTNNIRNRLMLELMARGGMRDGEVLKLTPADILDRKLILNDTKSGKEQELIFIPQKVADRLKEYVRVQKIAPTQLIFPICYGAGRAMKFTLGRSVITKLSDGLKTFMHKNYKGESCQTDSPAGSR
jgi:integrase/recombinase XerD